MAKITDSQLLADNIRLLMEEEELNLAQLANQIEVPKAVLNKILAGRSMRPRSATLNAIANYFKVSTLQLIQGGIERYATGEKIKNIPIVNWANINDWINGKLKRSSILQLTPTNLDVSEMAFALISNEMHTLLFKTNSILLFDPKLEIKDGAFVLVRLAAENGILLKQMIWDANNTKFIKSLNQGLSLNIRKLTSDDEVIAVLLMAKTLYY